MKKVLFIIFFIDLIFYFAFGMVVEYLGHSCVLLQIASNKILIDPYSFEMNYPYLKKLDIKENNLVLSTHEHFDHFNKDIQKLCLKFNIPYLVGTKDKGKKWNYIDYKLPALQVNSLGVYHDNVKGKERGLNSILIIEGKEENKILKVIHLGDLGHLLNDEEISKIKGCDILFIPVGGFFTISALQSIEIIKKVSPKIIFPIHYKTKYTQDFPIDEINVFLNLAQKDLKEYKIVKKSDRILDIKKIESKSIVYFELN